MLATEAKDKHDDIDSRHGKAMTKQQNLVNMIKENEHEINEHERRDEVHKMRVQCGERLGSQETMAEVKMLQENPCIKEE